MICPLYVRCENKEISTQQLIRLLIGVGNDGLSLRVNRDCEVQYDDVSFIALENNEAVLLEDLTELMLENGN